MKRLILGAALALALLVAVMGVLGAILHLLQQSLIALCLGVVGVLVFLSLFKTDDEDKP